MLSKIKIGGGAGFQTQIWAEFKKIVYKIGWQLSSKNEGNVDRTGPTAHPAYCNI